MLLSDSVILARLTKPIRIILYWQINVPIFCGHSDFATVACRLSKIALRVKRFAETHKDYIAMQTGAAEKTYTPFCCGHYSLHVFAKAQR